jgi:hypothetical protein
MTQSLFAVIVPGAPAVTATPWLSGSNDMSNDRAMRKDSSNRRR